MISPNKIKQLDSSDPRAEERLRVQDELRCPICPPNRGENVKRRSRHGARKAKYKDHFRNDFRLFEKRDRKYAAMERCVDEHELREDEHSETTAPCCGLHRDDCGCNYTPTTRNKG